MSFFNHIPKSFDPDAWDQYARIVDDVRIDNFGCVGTRLLLDWMGVCEAPEDFCQRSIVEGWIPKIGRLTGAIERGAGITWIRTRVVSHVQYELKAPGVQIQGEEAAENAYHGEVLGDSRWLRAVTPPFNPFADRRTCSEFRFFDRVIEALSRAGLASDPTVRAQVEGYITIHINFPPCVSCIGVVRQFQLLFKGVTLRMSGGRSVPVQVWPGPVEAEEELPNQQFINSSNGENQADASQGWHWGWMNTWDVQDQWWWRSSDPWQQWAWDQSGQARSGEDFER